MGNTLGISFADDMDEFVNDLSNTMIWGTQTIEGVTSIISKSEDVSDIGVFRDADIQFMCKASAFTNSILPALKAVVSINSIKYYISNIDYSEDSTVVKLSLMRRE